MLLNFPLSSSAKMPTAKTNGAPACAGAPQRSGHCRVSARPKLWTGAAGNVLWRRARENSVVVGALAVIGDVETLALLLHGGTQPDDHVDDLVEDRRTDARPDQGRQQRLALGQHLGAN